MRPIDRAILMRLEAAERAEERRRADEVAERVEQRQIAWMMERAQRLAWEGKPFDLNDPSTLHQPLEEFIAESFAPSEREAARDERRRMVEAGLLVPLKLSAAEMAAPCHGGARRRRRAPRHAAVQSCGRSDLICTQS